MHGRDGEVLGMYLLSDPINLSLSVDEDDCLGDGEGFIQVTQCVQLPLLGVSWGRKIIQGLYPTTYYQICLLHWAPPLVPH